MLSREEYITSGTLSNLPYEVGVYTQGKVGSKAVLRTLRDMHTDASENLHMYVWDFCRTSPEGVRRHQQILGTRSRLQVDEPEILEFMLAHPSRDMKLTTIVREPVAISLSSFFYNFSAKNPLIDIRTLTDEEIIGRLVAGEAFSHPTHHIDWFDTEVQPQMGVDVYSHGRFPIAEGFDVYAGQRGRRRAELLVFRLEDIAAVGAPALAKFYDMPERAIASANTADEKPYADKYRRFRQSARLPAEWVAWQLNSRYARFFYSEDERVMLARRWSGSSDQIHRQ